MDLKKLFKNNDAVSPVIGVILMVAITVILAAAIGSSVFGQGPAKSAPQSNIDIKAAGISGTPAVASITLEHLGGDPIHFESSTPLATKVMASIDNGNSIEIKATGVGLLSVGNVQNLELHATDSANTPLAVVPGNAVRIKIIDVKTNQLISDKEVRF